VTQLALSPGAYVMEPKDREKQVFIANRHLPLRAQSLRTTNRCPSSSTSSAKRVTYSSASARNAAAITRRAPARARSSSVIAICSLDSGSGSVRTSTVACLPSSALRGGFRLHQPGRYAAFILGVIHNFRV
jgi:hypothetical protein